MKPLSSFKRGVAEVRHDLEHGKYERALARVAKLLQDWPDNPQLLVMWADLIQLQESDEGPSLDDARAALQRASELEGPSPAALIELGAYYYAVDDDPAAANKTFDKAIRLCKRLLIDAILGRAKALGDLERSQEAFACLAQAYALQNQNGHVPGADTAEILEQLKGLSRAQ